MMTIRLTPEQIQTLKNLIDQTNWPGSVAEQVVELKQSLACAFPEPAEPEKPDEVT